MRRLIIISLVAVCALPIGNVFSADSGGKSVSDFLTPDGQFDLNAARMSGYQGPLDIGGFNSAINPVTGQPNI